MKISKIVTTFVILAIMTTRLVAQTDFLAMADYPTPAIPFVDEIYSEGNITIDKDNCTITKNGNTYKLYGKIKLVENFADLNIKIVNYNPDIKIKVVEYFPDKCGKVKLVENFPDLKIRIVENFPDLKIHVVENFPGF